MASGSPATEILKVVHNSMAASRGSSAARRICFRYQLFFFIVIFLLIVQLLMAWSFYSYHQTESEKLEYWRRRVEQLEKVHETLDNSRKDNKANGSNGNGVGAAEGVNVIPPPKELREVSLVASNQTKSNASKITIGDRIKDTARSWMNKLNEPKSEKTIEQHLNDSMKSGWAGPPCPIKVKEASYAIVRASSNSCRQLIAETACHVQEGTFFPKQLPRMCPLQDKTYMKYVGCMSDARDNRLLPSYNTNFRQDNTPKFCVDYCLRIGFAYAGVEFSHECWCGEKVPLERRVDESRCDSSCPGNRTQHCGGYLTANVYRTGIGSRPYTQASYVNPELLLTQEKPARIAFVLTLNGRAVRQVHRLIKAIYHSSHYYYIHVDMRQEYLYREMQLLASRYENIRVASWQMSTIWGGASLLKMHLRCIHDLLAIDGWEWDYFINLSESDFPIKPLEDLVAFLTKYKGKNFVKSHGRDTAKFIQKQGLDRVFVECDTHMWRIGTRSLPGGIRVDGGSDWVGLHRKFCEYLASTDDELYHGLLKYWTYTLLPSESFFHTMLVNSQFCSTVINNNLHHTNWVRSKGCKCQYKHVVDWCGCSPNDYLPKDIGKLMGQEGRPIYFGRKFEAIVSQRIINEIENLLFGSPPDDTPGMLSYWQNEFHIEDTNSKVDDAFRTFYHTFTQLSTEQIKKRLKDQGCSFITTKIAEVNLYAYADQIQGLVVQYTAKNFRDKSERILETFVQPQKKFTVMQSVGPVARLIMLEVSTNFDPKEEIFRNYGGLLGPYSDPILSHSWGAGQAFTATFVWIDPAGYVAASYDIPIKGEEQINTHEPTFEKPLRPGMWRIRLLYLWEPVAELQFLITPLLYYGGRRISRDDAKRVHSGPEKQVYVDRDFKDIQEALQLEEWKLKKKTADDNAQNSGADLEQWVQDLVKERWHISDTCIDGGSYSACPRLPSCQQSQWSTMSPDPKSELGPVDLHTGKIR